MTRGWLSTGTQMRPVSQTACQTNGSLAAGTESIVVYLNSAVIH
jgi:hypothetical protein